MKKIKISTGQIKHQTFQYKIIDRDIPINKVNPNYRYDIEGFDFHNQKIKMEQILF